MQLRHLALSITVVVASVALAQTPATAPVTDATWAFRYEDPAKPMLDLRFLNEKTAGESGFIRLSADGNDLVRGDGRSMRIWGVAANVSPKVSDEDLARHARFLARLGVNVVRVGGAVAGLIPQAEGSKITDANPAFVNDVQRLVAAMKKEGIYVRIAPFWDHGSVKYISPDWGIEGYKSGDSLNALLFVEPTLQNAWRSWMKTLLAEKNPHTGIALKDDPAVAAIQVVSEDSLFFWWTDKIKGGPRRILETRFAEFARAKHGSPEKAVEAWGNAALDGDAPGEGRLALYPLANLAQFPGQGNARRLRDQVEFMARTERDFYASAVKYLKEDLGCRQLIAASNFGPADPTHLGDLQRWTWSAADLLEFNSFFSTQARGPNLSYRVEAGHTFIPRSATRDPAIPALRKQVVGRPFVVSSTNWVAPNLYTAEGPIISAAYAAMQGLDGIFWFSATAPEYGDPFMPWAQVKGSSPYQRWTISHPGFISQFPAAALIYRQGLIDPAAVVVHEERTSDDLLDRRAPLIDERDDASSADRAEQVHPAVRGLLGKVRPEAYLIGRVQTRYEGDPAQSTVADLDACIDAKTGDIRSTHGQLVLNPGKGLLRIDAPKAQGVVGFLKSAGGRFACGDLSVESGNEYASVLAVAMDDRPLCESARVLVQVGTRSLPTGWQTRPAAMKTKSGEELPALEIVATGKLPWRIDNTDARITLSNSAVVEAILLDESGQAAQTLRLNREDGKVQLQLPPKSMYVMLVAPAAP